MTSTVEGLDRAALRDLKEIGKGGQGRVWATDAVRINQAWPAVYKEYEGEVIAGLDATQLSRMVSFVEELAPEDGRWLCHQAAWPAAVVWHDGLVRGFLMRRIPSDFELLLPPRDGARQRRPAGLQFLLNPDDYLAKMAIPVDDRKRLLLLAALAETLARFHALEVVVGDLSPNNLLFHLAEEPACFFLDCDAMRLRGDSVLDQAETPDWEVPAPEPLATPASDAYKFGLLAIRLFARDQSARDPAALTAISPDLGELAQRSQSLVPAERPAPADWLPALRAAATPGLTTGVPVRTLPPAPAPLLPPPPAAPPKRRLKLAMAFALVILASVGVTVALVGQDHERPAALPTAAETTFTTPETAETTYVPEPVVTAAASGIVSYDAVSGDPEGVAVAQTFAQYFEAINVRDWPAALAFYDPAGVVDPGSTKQRNAFIDSMSTTTDREATVDSVVPAGGETLAAVRFISEQEAGYGPKPDTEQTCTQWSITYRLTGSAAAGYRILRAREAQHQAC
ncbi:hypothetical protein [Winogradskya humida]|uniref:Protein kinase domain-containing protein n=1 Tax=Winogradskya humida TaxID=113566 RepID=A0ABQ3ZZ51_9ACTN|nr:hypothetical protein [Actinoplanes humidus]GIE23847.1 hypothetical protein Ahu01nite_069490 [Actinoplanes humidus]